MNRKATFLWSAGPCSGSSDAKCFMLSCTMLIHLSGKSHNQNRTRGTRDLRPSMVRLTIRNSWHSSCQAFVLKIQDFNRFQSNNSSSTGGMGNLLLLLLRHLFCTGMPSMKAPLTPAVCRTSSGNSPQSGAQGSAAKVLQFYSFFPHFPKHRGWNVSRILLDVHVFQECYAYDYAAIDQRRGPAWSIHSWFIPVMGHKNCFSLTRVAACCSFQSCRVPGFPSPRSIDKTQQALPALLLGYHSRQVALMKVSHGPSRPTALLICAGVQHSDMVRHSTIVLPAYRFNIFGMDLHHPSKRVFGQETS